MQKLIEGNMEESQRLKDEMEDSQRRDRKLRAQKSWENSSINIKVSSFL